MDLCSKSRLVLLLTLLDVALFPAVHAAPATNTPVPPLQWLEITNQITGSPAPPGLSYASIGFDPTSRTILIFGGESNGFPQQQTYLLNLSGLSWFSPHSTVDTLADVKPPPRSMAISGDDFAASNRHGHVVIGGKGQNGQPLSDAWEFDYINQFWTEINISPGGPSPRYSASGGIDVTASPVTDLNVQGPNNTFYLAGGDDGQNALSLSDVWEFEVAGVLTSNNANNVVGSWKQIQFSDSLPTRVRQGGTVMPSALVVAAGGCPSTSSTDNTCAQQDSHVLNVNATRDISPDGCPAPRVGPVIVPNLNLASSSFATQALMLLGTFNISLWDDGNGLNRGEVDILDVDTGVWTRVIPAGDPSSGTVKYPAPREGAVAFSSANALVGANPSVGSDILVFGGKDANGNYLSDVWVLRGYRGQITESNGTWSGFGNGQLGSGADASGTGVTVQYLTSCAQALSPAATSSSSGPSSSSPATPTSPGSSGQKFFPYDTGAGHKVSSPVSVALLLAALVFYRMSMPLTAAGALTSPRVGFIWLAGLTGLAAFAVGIAGVVLAFTTISSTSGGSLRKRSSTSLFLKTNHGKAALAFFAILYGALPLLFALSFIRRRKRPKQALINSEQVKERERQDSNETGFTALMTPAREKAMNGHRATASSPDVTQMTQPDSPVTESRTRRRSFFGGHLWYGHKKERHSTESSGPQDSLNGNDTKRSFEVLNRGNRPRRLSGSAWNALSSEGGHSVQASMPRSLSDLNWLDRRHNVAAFSDLDYALTQLDRAQAATPSADLRPTSRTTTPRPRPILPPRPLSILHVLLHAAIFGICIVVLVQLWERAPKAAFAVFLVWTIAFYSILILLAWKGMPRASILSVLLSSLRYHNEASQAPDPCSAPSSRPLSRNELYAFPTEPRSPYTFHQPPVRRAVSTQEEDLLSSNSHGGHRFDGDDEDEETQQRRIEEEMARRDVSIVTVPKRKLWITNPS
ncbi:uncharacterized protein FOMMEDRAFT_21769 [Fomitiporia mediterranea MF3/22]|uniref:uncharacterized protein n=1 Tax=Fomitiporia mediterranea (strain MF3/22) TaxID=694068 RepID=UPI000440754A|nr:uncharacterized protein FOMMEDRAFT_21769 [Fomitiporia mediterranea MF3/22]EJD01377.1 hypothetical protein FOMMEDRAFT_21769 [Fomitiporia mediterranea MF3/22]